MGYRKSRSTRAHIWGIQIRNFRKNQVRLTQDALAKEIVRVSGETVTCTQSTVAHWERGDFEPAIGSQRWIAKALGTDVDILFVDPERWAA